MEEFEDFEEYNDEFNDEENDLLKDMENLNKQYEDLNKQFLAMKEFSSLIEKGEIPLSEYHAEEFKKQTEVIEESLSKLEKLEKFEKEDLTEDKAKDFLKALKNQEAILKELSSSINEGGIKEGLIDEYEIAVIRLGTEVQCFSDSHNIEIIHVDGPNQNDFSNMNIPENLKYYLEKGELQSVCALNIPAELKNYFEKYVKIAEVGGFFKVKENGHIVKLTYSFEGEDGNIYSADIIEPESREIDYKFLEEEIENIEKIEEIKEKLKDNPYINLDHLELFG